MSTNAWPRKTIRSLIEAGAITAHKDGNYGSLYPRVEEFGDVGVPFLTAKSLDSGKIDIDGAPRLADDRADTLPFGFVQPKDVLLSHNATIGRVAIVPEFQGRMLVGTSLTYFRLNAEMLRPQYFAAFLAGTDFQNQLISVMSHSTRNQVPITAQRDLSVVVPPIDFQDQVATTLGALDDKIEQNRRTGRALEALAQATFKSWFVDFEPVKAKAAGQTRFPGMSAAAFTALPNRLIDSPLGRVPEGWDSTTLGSEFDFQVGFAFKSSGFTDASNAVRLVRGDNVKEGWIEWGNKTRRWNDLDEKFNRYHLAVGDVVIGMDGSKLGKNWARVREFDLPSLLVQRVARFRSTGAAGSSLLWLLISHHAFRDFVDAVKTGTSIPHISGGQLKSFSFIKPGVRAPLVWAAFEEVVAPLIAMADHAAGESTKLATLRDYLLPRLLSGQVTVERNAPQIFRETL